MTPTNILSLAIGWVLCVFIAALGALVVYMIYTGKIDLARLISEPNGDASMSRFQLLIFTFVIALSLFLVVIGNGSTGASCSGCPHFPEIPGTILSLLGISASSYLVSKGIQFSNDEGVRDRPPDVNISPSSADVRPGETKTFTADVIRSENKSVTWSINPEVGSIRDGVYTAPPADQVTQPVTLIQVQAVSVADPQGIGRASIRLLKA